MLTVFKSVRHFVNIESKLDDILLFCKVPLIGCDCVPRCLFHVLRAK